MSAFVDTLDPEGVIVVSGGARGVDKVAEVMAKARGIEVDIYPVSSEEWDRLGKKAGMLRNRVIEQNCDECHSFWTGDKVKSSGSYGMLKIMVKSGKPTWWHTVDGRMIPVCKKTNSNQQTLFTQPTTPTKSDD